MDEEIQTQMAEAKCQPLYSFQWESYLIKLPLTTASDLA